LGSPLESAVVWGVGVNDRSLSAFLDSLNGGIERGKRFMLVRVSMLVCDDAGWFAASSQCFV
jgi:hypothetical protein